MLTINRYVIHELFKLQNKTEASTTFSQALGEVNDFAEILLNEVHQTYSDSTSLKNTTFVKRNDKVFKNEIEKYVESYSDDEFYEFSTKSLKELENEIISEPFAVGGFYLYADYSISNARYIIVVLLRKKAGLNLRLVNGTYVVDPSENLNIDKIGMGFRLNVSIYADADDNRNYIALITSQKDKISTYFKDWVVAAGVASDQKNSDGLVNIVKNIPLPKNENGQDEMDRNEFTKSVYNFIESSPTKMVNLMVLGEHFYGEDSANALIEYAEKNGIIIDNEFKRNASSIKRLITIKAHVKGVDLSVDYDRLNENEVDIHSDMIIIRIPEIIEQIKSQRKSIDNQ